MAYDLRYYFKLFAYEFYVSQFFDVVDCLFVSL